MTEKVIDTFTTKIGKAPVAILMPVHNEEGTIEETINAFYNAIGSKLPVELVISEDGSSDNTREVVEKIGEKIPLKATLSSSRKGYAGGIKSGLKLVEAEYVLITDSDGQHDPCDFWKLWRLRTKYDILSGWRKSRADAFHRKVMSKAFQTMVKLAFNIPKLMDITAPFKLMRTDVAKEIASECQYMNESFWSEFMIRAHAKGFSIAEIPVNHKKRADNSSTRVYKPWKIPKIAYNQLTALFKLRVELNGKAKE
ncbi:MAG: glycosyltransferase family 2 protein [Candidatus Bathyarchaeia archaeon]